VFALINITFPGKYRTLVVSTIKNTNMKRLITLSIVAALNLMAFSSTAQQNCTISCPDNLIVTAEKNKEGAVVTFPAASITGDCGAATITPASGSFFRIGSHSIIITSATGQKCSFTLIVTDNEPPVLSDILLSSQKIWPPSNKMKKVGVLYRTSDNGQKVTSKLTVTSNDTNSDDKDYEIIDEHLVRLKAARLPNGESRIFTISVTSTDEAGNKTTKSTSIAVSKNIDPM